MIPLLADNATDPKLAVAIVVILRIDLLAVVAIAATTEEFYTQLAEEARLLLSCRALYGALHFDSLCIRQQDLCVVVPVIIRVDGMANICLLLQL